MIEGLILIEGINIQEDSLMISLSNALQIVIGRAPSFGFVLHIAANTTDDLTNAILSFSTLPDVTAISILTLRLR